MTAVATTTSADFVIDSSDDIIPAKRWRSRTEQDAATDERAARNLFAGGHALQSHFRTARSLRHVYTMDVNTAQGWLVERTKKTAPSAQKLAHSASVSRSIVSALRTIDIEHAAARLKSFESYEDDWDGEGAPKPNKRTVEAAIALLQKLQPWHPRPLATLDANGNAVIEFRDEDTNLFGKIRFVGVHDVEMFAIIGDGAPAYIDGIMDSQETAEFLSNQLQITVHP